MSYLFYFKIYWTNSLSDPQTKKTARTLCGLLPFHLTPNALLLPNPTTSCLCIALAPNGVTKRPFATSLPRDLQLPVWLGRANAITSWLLVSPKEKSRFVSSRPTSRKVSSPKITSASQWLLHLMAKTWPLGSLTVPLLRWTLTRRLKRALCTPQSLTALHGVCTLLPPEMTAKSLSMRLLVTDSAFLTTLKMSALKSLPAPNSTLLARQLWLEISTAFTRLASTQRGPPGTRFAASRSRTITQSRL